MCNIIFVVFSLGKVHQWHNDTDFCLVRLECPFFGPSDVLSTHFLAKSDMKQINRYMTYSKNLESILTLKIYFGNYFGEIVLFMICLLYCFEKLFFLIKWELFLRVMEGFKFTCMMQYDINMLFLEISLEIPVPKCLQSLCL